MRIQIISVKCFRWTITLVQTLWVYLFSIRYCKTKQKRKEEKTLDTMCLVCMNIRLSDRSFMSIAAGRTYQTLRDCERKSINSCSTGKTVWFNIMNSRFRIQNNNLYLYKMLPNEFWVNGFPLAEFPPLIVAIAIIMVYSAKKTNRTPCAVYCIPAIDVLFICHKITTKWKWKANMNRIHGNYSRNHSNCLIDLIFSMYFVFIFELNTCIAKFFSSNSIKLNKPFAKSTIHQHIYRPFSI